MFYNIVHNPFLLLPSLLITSSRLLHHETHSGSATRVLGFLSRAFLGAASIGLGEVGGLVTNEP
jgi:hypothetical protein